MSAAAGHCRIVGGELSPIGRVVEAQPVIVKTQATASIGLYIANHLALKSSGYGLDPRAELDGGPVCLGVAGGNRVDPFDGQPDALDVADMGGALGGKLPGGEFIRCGAATGEEPSAGGQRQRDQRRHGLIKERHHIPPVGAALAAMLFAAKAAPTHWAYSASRRAASPAQPLPGAAQFLPLNHVQRRISAHAPA